MYISTVSQPSAALGDGESSCMGSLVLGGILGYVAYALLLNRAYKREKQERRSRELGR